MMNRNRLFSLLALLAFTAPALADYVPGRIRPLMGAELEVLNAGSSLLKEVKAAQLSLNSQDDAFGPASLSLNLEHNNKMVQMTAPITQIQRTECGNTYIARGYEAGGSYVIKLVDYSTAVCEVYISHVWQVNVSLTNSTGQSDMIFLGAKKIEHYINTL